MVVGGWLGTEKRRGRIRVTVCRSLFSKISTAASGLRGAAVEVCCTVLDTDVWAEVGLIVLDKSMLEGKAAAREANATKVVIE